MTESIDLPLFKSHKEVRAGKIQRIERTETGYALFCSVHADGDASVIVTAAWLEKFSPQVGGYVVIYEDGYRSYSPSEVFEAGYTKVGAAAVRAQDDADQRKAKHK